MIRVLSIALMLGLLTSCTTLKQLIGLTINPPTVKLMDAKLVRVNMQEISIELLLDIHNRNDIDLAFRNLKYSASMFKIKLTEGIFKEEIIAKADSHTSFTVPLTVPTQEAARVAQHLLMKGTDNAVLKLDAEAAFITDAGDITVDFSGERKLLN